MSIQVTGDGSHTIHSEKFDVTYHSIHGALQETNHVFIDAGLKYLASNQSALSILEVGFGTGLNVLATMMEAKKSDLSIDFHTIEAFPISSSVVAELNYADYLDGIDKTDITNLHHSSWNTKIQVSDQFGLTKHLITLEKYQTDLKFDLIYFDAFAPTAQPELWEPAIMQKMYDLLNSDGLLVTYCAKGQFKRDLKLLGFEVQSIPGPPRKREMTRAIKK